LPRKAEAKLSAQTRSVTEKDMDLAAVLAGSAPGRLD